MNENQTEAIMKIIANAGNGKSEAILALRSAKNNEFESSVAHLKAAKKALKLSHNAQTELLTDEASGAEFEINLLTIHSQDHLMNTITFVDLVEEIIDIIKTKY